MQNKLYASNPCNISNVQHIYSNYLRPMSNVGYSIDQYETPHGQEDVSRFYPLVADPQYAGLSPDRPMDGGIGYAGTSDLAGYSQPTYTAPYMITQLAPYVINISASCGTSETHNSASHFHGVHSRTCANLTGAHVPLSSTDAYEFDDWKEKHVAYFKRSMPFTWNTKKIHMIPLQYKLMRCIRRNVKRSVDNSRSSFNRYK